MHEAGKSERYDRELKCGWHRLVGAREGNKPKLYIDGKLTATSTAFNPADCDLSNDRPLKIGFGAHDYFNDCMRDVRVYGRALSEEEIAAMHGGR